jgi:hypothetical protein
MEVEYKSSSKHQSASKLVIILVIWSIDDELFDDEFEEQEVLATTKVMDGLFIGDCRSSEVSSRFLIKP